MAQAQSETINVDNTKLYVTIPQKDVILSYFKDDLTLVTKYCKMISNDFDKNFKYFVFKDFIFAAADMMKDIDRDLYNDKLLKAFKVIQNLDKPYADFNAKSKHVLTVYINEFLHWQEDYVTQKKRSESLQTEIQTLISNELVYSEKFKVIKVRIEELKAKGELDLMPEEEQSKIKQLRREHIDTIHLLGERRKEVERLLELLSNFEEEHKVLFQKYFKEIKEKIDSQYKMALDYFGYKFNKKLFIEAGRSLAVQRFKQKAHIFGDLNLCKYVEYYLKNIKTDNLADQKKRENLNAAKQYCKNERERENLF